MTAPRETPIRIVRQGAIRVASACVEHEGNGIVALWIECDGRYDLMPAHGDRLTLMVYRGPNDPTEVELPEFAEGWEVWASDYNAKGAARLCLVRRASDGQRKEDDDGN